MKETSTPADFTRNQACDLEAVINRYRPYAGAIISQAGFIKEDEEELLADCFFIVWKNWPILTPDTNVKAYIAGVLHNLIKQRYRQNRHTPATDTLAPGKEEPVDPKTLPALWEEREKHRLVLQTVLAKPLQQQEIFFGFYAQNKTVRTLSSEQHCSQSKVKVTLHRLRKELQHALKQAGYAGNPERRNEHETK